MAHLTLANAKRGAENITHNRYPNLRLKQQFGRCFVLNGHGILSTGTDWEQCLEQLTVAQLQSFAQRNNLDIPADAEFTPLAELFINNPDELVILYSKPVNPLLPEDVEKPSK